jgi:hypothetical protein
MLTLTALTPFAHGAYSVWARGRHGVYGYGGYMVSLWFRYGFAMVSLWFRYGFAMVWLWNAGFPCTFTFTVTAISARGGVPMLNVSAAVFSAWFVNWPGPDTPLKAA